MGKTKKRIFITTYYMEIGGVERSLIGLLNSVDYSRFEVDLFLHRHSGPFLELIPEAVNLLPENRYYATYARPVKDLLKEGFFKIALARTRAALKAKRESRRKNISQNGSALTYALDATLPFLPPVNPGQTYDLAISFLMPHHVALHKVKARKKIAWIHTDYSTVYLNKKAELPNWEPFDHIVSISESVSRAFLSVFPEFRDRLLLIENILSPAQVRTLAKAFTPEKPENAIVFCSVGRISYAKNFDQVPFICAELVAMGFDICWQLIGDGGDTALIEQNIAAAGMEDRVFLLGNRPNPYPYMKACDFYLQLSRYEGKAVTVREAQILEKPVIIADFPTAASQLEDGTDGIIVPMENKAAAKAIAAFITNPEKQKEIQKNLKKRNYGNEEEIEKIEELLK